MGNTAAKSIPSATVPRRLTKKHVAKTKPEDGVPAWQSPTGPKSYTCIDMDMPGGEEGKLTCVCSVWPLATYI